MCVYCSECKTPTQNCWVLIPKFLDIPCISLLDPEPAKLLLQWILVSLNGPITLPVRQAQYPKVIFILFLPQFYFQSVSNCCPIILTMPLQADSLSAVLTPLSLSAALHHFSFGLLLRSLKWSPSLYRLASAINTTHCCHNYLPKIQISSCH